jgi:tRNA dimethylallyltransferase
MKIEKPKIIVIVGPTASGKTSLSIKLAKKFNGEIISADSRQVYKGMNLGTGKVTKEEMQGIKHYLIDIISPKKTLTVVQYIKKAKAAIKKIISKNKIPIIVGGTGFYVDALVFDYKFPQVPPNLKLRKTLEKKSTQELFKMLKKIDPQRAKNIDPNNKVRLIRAIEIAQKLGKVPELKKELKYNPLFIGIKISKEKLKEKIKKRLIKRLKQGMIKEVEKLKKQGLSWKKLESFGLEYRYIAYYLQNKISYKQMLNQLEKAIINYAKRQMTWFKKNKNINWILNYNEAQKLVKEFLK